MKRSLWLAVAVLVAVSPAGMGPAGRHRAAQSRGAAPAGGHRPAAQAPRRSREEAGADRHAAKISKQEAQTQAEAVESVRESLLGRVNLNGYYNFRLAADESPTPFSFQQHHLGLLLGKQLKKFSFHMELELQNVPHHPEIHGEEEEGEEGEHAEETDVSGEGQVAVENAWMEYSHNRYMNVRVGKQLSPQYWWQNHYPNLTLSTDQPIYLRELFPPELVGVTVHGAAARPSGQSELALNYRVYLSNNQFEGNSQADLRDAQVVGRTGPAAPADRRTAEAVRRRRGPLPRPDRPRDQRARRRSRRTASRARSRSTASSSRRNTRAAGRSARRATVITCSPRCGSPTRGRRSTASSSSTARGSSAPSSGTWRG